MLKWEKGTMKTYKIYCPIYDVTLDFWVGETEKDFIHRVKKLFNETLIADGRSGCFVSFNKNKKVPQRITHRILWIEKPDKFILLHEVFHAVTNILAYKNIHLTLTTEDMYEHSSDEVYAYFLEYLYKETLKKLGRCA